MDSGRYLHYLNGVDGLYLPLPDGVKFHKAVSVPFEYNKMGGKSTIIYSSSEKSFCIIWYIGLEYLFTVLDKMIRDLELPIDMVLELTLIDGNGGYGFRKALIGEYINEKLEAFDYPDYQKENFLKFPDSKKDDLFDNEYKKLTGE